MYERQFRGALQISFIRIYWDAGNALGIDGLKATSFGIDLRPFIRDGAPFFISLAIASKHTSLSRL